MAISEETRLLKMLEQDKNQYCWCFDGDAGDAGLILIDETDTDSYRGNLLRFGGFVKRAKARADWYELSPTGLMHYLKIGCMKWVNR